MKKTAEIRRPRNTCASRKRKQEMIALAAIRLKNGSIFTGATHADAVELVANAYPDEARILDFAEDGFTTTRGRFLDREHAYDVAQKAEQVYQIACDYEAVPISDPSKALKHSCFTPAEKMSG